MELGCRVLNERPLSISGSTSITAQSESLSQSLIMLEKILTLTPKHIHLINNIAYNSWVLVQTYAQICLLTTEEATPELEKLIVSVLPSVKCN